MPKKAVPWPVDELRIHGVSGSPGPKLLGFETSAGTRLCDPLPTDSGYCVVRRRADTARGTVDGFDWGSINSTSWRITLWIFLLPFSLVNAAGWMLPAAQKSKWHVSRLLIALVGLTLTATWTAWLVDVVVNYVAFQNVARKANPGHTYGLPFGWHYTWVDPRRDFVVAAYVVVVAVIAAVAFRAWKAPDHAAQRPSFFPSHHTFLSSVPAHLAAALACVAASMWPAVDAVTSPTFDAADKNHLVGMDMAGLLLGIAFAQTVFAALLWLTAAVWPRVRSQAHGAAAGTVTLACLLTGAFLSGAALWITSALPKVLRVPFYDAGRGSDLGSADYYGWVVLTGLVAAAVAYNVVKRRAPTTSTGTHFPRWDKKVRTGERRAYVSRRFDLPLTAFAFAGGLVLVFFAFRHVRWSWDGLDLTTSSEGVMSNVARWALPLAAAAAVGFVARNTFGAGKKKTISIIWDVLTFFPRDFHPLAVRCYSFEVVPRFGVAINERTTGPNQRVLLSAHSQGSIITYAALHELPLWTVPKVALVTYGCPIVTLYGRNFPALFNSSHSAQLNALIDGRWHNYFRFTDPIGGPVFAADERGQAYGAQDHVLDDPATAPPQPDPGDAPLEYDREREMYLALHSYYLREQALKQNVAGMRSAAW